MTTLEKHPTTVDIISSCLSRYFTIASLFPNCFIMSGFYFTDGKRSDQTLKHLCDPSEDASKRCPRCFSRLHLSIQGHYRAPRRQTAREETQTPDLRTARTRIREASPKQRSRRQRPEEPLAVRRGREAPRAAGARAIAGLSPEPLRSRPRPTLCPPPGRGDPRRGRPALPLHRRPCAPAEPPRGLPRPYLPVMAARPGPPAARRGSARLGSAPAPVPAPAGSADPAPAPGRGRQPRPPVTQGSPPRAPRIFFL